MMKQEAQWLAECMTSLPDANLSPLLNLGSSSADFRGSVQPWIDRLLFQPLTERGVDIIHCDLKSQPGVDVVADLLDAADVQRLMNLNTRSVLCSNVLEHVVDLPRFCQSCAELVQEGGYLIVTVPRSYPYHADPVDTLFRPSPEEIRALFAELTVIAAEVLQIPSDYRARIRRNWAQPAWDALLLPYLWARFRSVKMSRLAWIRRPFEVSCVVLQRPGPR